MQAQCLADFTIDLESKWWKLYVVCSSNEKGIDVGIILESLYEVILEQSLRFEFKKTNKQAEYEALLVGLRLVKEVEAKYLKCWSNSKLVTGQLNGEYHTKDPQMTRYYYMATRLFSKFELQHNFKEINELANLLSKLASTKKKKQHWTIIQEIILEPSLDKVVASVTPLGWEWMTEI